MKGMMPTCILVLGCCVVPTTAFGCGGSSSDGQKGVIPDTGRTFGTSDTSQGGNAAGGDAMTTPDAGAVSADVTTGPEEVGSGGCQSDTDCLDMIFAEECRTATCDVATGLCSVSVVSDGTSCGEDDLCKTAGACAQGFCIGQPVKCDDGNPCTDGTCKEGEGCVYFDNAAACDDVDACTANDQCDGGKCLGTPVADCGASCGDGVCDDGEDCANCAVDCQPCSTAACDDGEVENCDGGCSPSTAVGDGTCQPELDCSATGYDGNDCEAAPVGPCGQSEIAACQGVCVSALVFADMLANETCDEALNCGTFDYDMGACIGGAECGASDFLCADGDGCVATMQLCDGSEDCNDGSDEANCAEPGTCPEGQKVGCTGTCYTAAWFGDGICDSFLDCAATDWDGGDCSETTGGGGDTMECAAGEVLACEGTYCLSASWLGDGMCDLPLDCAATDADGGDCDPDSTGGGSDDGLDCAGGTQANCAGTYCYNSEWIGDGTCDSFFDCSATEWDGGDCP